MLFRFGKLTLMLLVAWCVMTVCHEGGHVIGGWVGGGVLQAVDLSPWSVPYSIFSPDPIPLLTLWSGPILGVVVPGLAALLLRNDLMSFIAYFCLLANGLYLATAWIANDRFLDTAKLLEHGCHPIWIVVYCLLTMVWGYWGFRQQCLRVFGFQHDTGHIEPN